MNSKTQTPTTQIGGVSAPTELLREFTQLSRKFERKLEKLTAVNPTDRVVMETLMQRGPLTPSELAAAARITPAAMTAAIDRLIDMNHVRRETHPTDRRKLIVTASEKSAALIMGELMTMVLDINETVSGYTEAEVALITNFLTSVNAAYSRHVDDVD